MEFLAQGIGIAAMILSAISFQMNTKKKIIVMQIITSVVFAAHYFMIDAVAAGVVNTIAIVRNVVLYRKDKLPLGGKVWVGLFCTVMAVSAFVSRPEPISVLMSIGMIFNTLAVAAENPQKVRKTVLISSPFVLLYNIFVMSIGGIINEILVEICTAVTMIRERKA